MNKKLKLLFGGLMVLLALIGAVVYYDSFICDIWPIQILWLMVYSLVAAILYPVVWIFSVKDAKGTFLDDLMAWSFIAAFPVGFLWMMDILSLPPYADLWPTWQMYVLSFISLVAFPLISAVRIGISLKKA